MTARDILVLLIVGLCAALSFLFSGMEAGVLALNRFRIRQRMKAGDKRAAVLHGFLGNPENFLWTILVGNTVVNFIIFGVGAFQLFFWLGGRPLLWLFAFLSGVFVFYIACELTPKTLFQRYPNRLALEMARPFRLIHRLLSPWVAVADWVGRGLLHWTGGQAFTGRLFGSREELRFVMQESSHGLSSEERAMINRVLDLPNLRVRHVMIPLSNLIAVDSTLPLSEVLALCREQGLTRVPVTDARTGRISGIINLDRVLYMEGLDVAKPAQAHLQAPFFLPAEMNLEEALRRMQKSGGRMAIVLGAQSRELGIVTLQDILKVIFGEVKL